MIEWDIDELACAVCGKGEDETEKAINGGEVDQLVADRYGIDMETYYEIVKDLLPFTPTVQTPLTSEHYHAFVKDGAMIVKYKA